MSSFRVVSRKITRRFPHALHTIDRSENRKLQTQPIPVNVRLPDQTIYFRKRGEEVPSPQNSTPITLRYRLEDKVKIAHPPEVFKRLSDLELREVIIRSAENMFRPMTQGTINEILDKPKDNRSRAYFDTPSCYIIKFFLDQGDSNSELIVTCINIYLPETIHPTRQSSNKPAIR